MEPSKARIYESGSNAKRKGNYASNDHKRQRRGMFRLAYGPYEFVFYPARFWPAHSGLSVSGMRSMIVSKIIVMYKRHNTDICSLGELAVIKRAVIDNEVTFRQQAKDNPQFISEVRQNLNTFRTHMDMIKAGREPDYADAFYSECMDLNINDRNSSKENQDGTTTQA